MPTGGGAFSPPAAVEAAAVGLAALVLAADDGAAIGLAAAALGAADGLATTADAAGDGAEADGFGGGAGVLFDAG